MRISHKTGQLLVPIYAMRDSSDPDTVSFSAIEEPQADSLSVASAASRPTPQLLRLDGSSSAPSVVRRSPVAAAPPAYMYNDSEDDSDEAENADGASHLFISDARSVVSGPSFAGGASAFTGAPIHVPSAPQSPPAPGARQQSAPAVRFALDPVMHPPPQATAPPPQPQAAAPVYRTALALASDAHSAAVARGSEGGVESRAAGRSKVSGRGVAVPRSAPVEVGADVIPRHMRSMGYALLLCFFASFSRPLLVRRFLIRVFRTARWQ
jgi:hypothetical protein